MSLKAEWDEDARLVTKCEVLAAWQGLRIERRRNRWAIRLLDNPRQPPLAQGLTIQGVEAYLLGLNNGKPRRQAQRRLHTVPA